jgi:hypothetical protein
MSKKQEIDHVSILLGVDRTVTSGESDIEYSKFLSGGHSMGAVRRGSDARGGIQDKETTG